MLCSLIVIILPMKIEFTFPITSLMSVQIQIVLKKTHVKKKAAYTNKLSFHVLV